MAAYTLLGIFLVLCLLTGTTFGRFNSATLTEGASETCVYTLYVKTGSAIKGGTDSKINATFSDIYNNSVLISDLEKWGGLMPNGWDYFERGNIDIFSGRGYCLSTAPCKLYLASDGTGSGHGWYVNYVEVSITGPHMGCAQKRFDVEAWLATDRYPYKLDAFVDLCKTSELLELQI